MSTQRVSYLITFDIEEKTKYPEALAFEVLRSIVEHHDDWPKWANNLTIGTSQTPIYDRKETN